MCYVFKIAIIQFPGTNCEQESARAIKMSGMKPVYFRWNENLSKLKSFDGFFIPGGFSYEDRVRAGAIAARDPLMVELKKKAKAGKPIIGICNGAQILVESGLIPGLKNYHLGASLAHNNNGYLNIPVNIRNSAEQGRSAFNNFAQNHYFQLPIASGEGRFFVPKSLLEQLIQNQQIIFRYCDDRGVIEDGFPINPNGAVNNIAGICNPMGNVLALMPHPERVASGQVIFDSMKKYLQQLRINKVNCEARESPLGENEELRMKDYKKIQYDSKENKLINYKKPKDAIEILVKLIITDNEAQTLKTSLVNLGFKNIKVRRFVHWEIGLKPKTDKVINNLIKSGEILNTNKEIPYINRSELKFSPATNKILVREKESFTDYKKLDILNNRLGIREVESVKKSILWEIDCSHRDWQAILKQNILFNPHSQDGLIYQ